MNNIDLVRRCLTCGKVWLTSLLTIACHLAWTPAKAHEVYNFNSDWVIDYSELTSGVKTGTERVTLPHAWNEDEAFRVYISEQSGGIVWYRKTFTLPQEALGQRVILEFEGCRMAADVRVNGHEAGYSETGVMAFGIDISDLVHGYAQRTTNEWLGVGQCVPAWVSDYSNDLMVKSGGNVVRWMHVCPWIQDVQSCDRVGLIQAMPAGDAEADASGQQWIDRTEVMRDGIIYLRWLPQHHLL